MSIRTASSKPEHDLPGLTIHGGPAGHEDPSGAGPDDASPGKLARLSGLTALLFGVLFVAGLVLVDSAPHLGDPDVAFTRFYASDSTALVTTGLYLVPFAGIAFLWHVVSVRLLITRRTATPSPVPSGLQLVSAVLFVALLFAGTATAGAVALLKDLTAAPLPPVGATRALLATGYSMVFVYAVRGAGMYAITTTTLLLRAGVLPRWLALISYLMAAFLLVSTTVNPVVVLLFPGWVVLVGLVLLRRAGQLDHPTPASPGPNA